MSEPKQSILVDWWYVDKQLVPPALYNHLVLHTLDEQLQPVDIPVYTMTQTEDGSSMISFPRYCEYGETLIKQGNFIDGRTDGEDIQVNMKVSPRDKFQENAINTLVASDHGICQAKTAFGKTFVAIAVMAKLKKKTLILVHKTPLAEQWKHDILQYTDLDPHSIEILKGSKYDLSKPVIISTVQNFIYKNNTGEWDLRNKFISANFGITFYDEVHVTAGPSSFVQSSRWFASRRIYGLSATPKRGDDFDKMIRWTVGDIIYTDERPIMPVYLTYVPTPVRPDARTLKHWSYCGNDYMRKYLIWLAESEMYKTTVTKILVDLIKLDKKVLAVGAYKAILDQVYQWVVDELTKQHIPITKVIMVHGTSSKTLVDLQSNTNSLILSTNKFFSDGLSVAWLDTLVYLTPPSAHSMVNIPQLVGRIVRSYQGKQYVTVYDIYNNDYDVEIGRRGKRELKYKEFNYHIIHIKNNDYVNEFENIVKDMEQSLV